MEPTIPNEDDSSRTQFWERRWEAGKMPWDLGGIPPALVSFLSRERSPSRVLIPGCGSGYEVQAFHKAGHDVIAIEFSASAVARAQEVLGPLGTRVIHGNFFKHDFGSDRYDWIYERGFLCSLPTQRWPDYARQMAQLLEPGGSLVGLFLYGLEPEPPPFPLTEQLASELFQPYFKLVRTEKVESQSVPVYQGLEHWQEWKRV